MNTLSAESLVSNLDNLCQKEDNLKSMTCVLKDLTDATKANNYKLVLTINSWNSTVKVTGIVQKVLSKDYFEDEELDFLAEFLRFLRNSCGGGVVQNQQFILSSQEILSCVKKTISSFKEKKSAKEVIVLKCCIQVIGNLVCLSNEAKAMVWNYFLEQNIFQALFKHENCAVNEYTMMVLYNCMYEESSKHLISTRAGQQIITSLLNSLCCEIVDWGILFLESILKKEYFFQNCYENLPIRSRLLVLDVIIEQLSSGPGNAYFFVPHSSINYIKDLFIGYTANIVQIFNSETSDMKPLEIVRVLSLLCDASCLDDYSGILKCSRELLETSLDVLRCIHILGKSDSNLFSRICNLKVMSQEHRDEIENNPSYGFKKSLIRLIGNLCFNCKDNQDTVRKLDGIPLLLDCCNIDARNPFIQQWCVLAIRNIMEKNYENQAILAGITLTEDLHSSSLLTELGFEAKKENGKYVLRTLRA